MTTVPTMMANTSGVISSAPATPSFSSSRANTEVMAAPMSGSPLFTMTAVVAVPDRLSIDELRDAMDRIAHDVGVEASVMAHR